MHYYSGAPVHLCSGVDSVAVNLLHGPDTRPARLYLLLTDFADAAVAFSAFQRATSDARQ